MDVMRCAGRHGGIGGFVLCAVQDVYICAWTARPRAACTVWTFGGHWMCRIRRRHSVRDGVVEIASRAVSKCVLPGWRMYSCREGTPAW
jgi:hypothetical protein